MSKFIVLALMFAPFISSAATYHYVTATGEIASVEASSPQEAMARAYNIASNSGVALDMGVIENGEDVSGGTVADGQATGGSNTYHYVTTSGYTASVQANSPENALMVAPNRAPNSGVAIDRNIIENGEEVESVSN